jgi:hypothetical protein
MTADRSIGRQSHQKKAVWSTGLVGRHFDMSKSSLMVKFKSCLDLEYHLWITIALEGNRQWHSEEKTRCGLQVMVEIVKFKSWWRLLWMTWNFTSQY